MNKKVKQVKLLREEESKYIDGKLKFRHIEENYNTSKCDLDFFLDDVKSSMEIIKNHAKQVLFCSDNEIHIINEYGWYEVTKFEIIYEGGKK